jgi:hypothetical protein
MADLAREHGISEATIYTWKSNFAQCLQSTLCLGISGRRTPKLASQPAATSGQIQELRSHHRASRSGKNIFSLLSHIAMEFAVIRMKAAHVLSWH